MQEGCYQLWSIITQSTTVSKEKLKDQEFMIESILVQESVTHLTTWMKLLLYGEWWALHLLIQSTIWNDLVSRCQQYCVRKSRGKYTNCSTLLCSSFMASLSSIYTWYLLRDHKTTDLPFASRTHASERYLWSLNSMAISVNITSQQVYLNARDIFTVSDGTERPKTLISMLTHEKKHLQCTRWSVHLDCSAWQRLKSLGPVCNSYGETGTWYIEGEVQLPWRFLILNVDGCRPPAYKSENPVPFPKNNVNIIERCIQQRHVLKPSITNFINHASIRLNHPPPII